MEFKIGDPVKWESEIRGIIIKRKGIILYIIDSFEKISDIIKTNNFKDKIRKNFNLIHNNLNEFRTEKSYLVISVKADEQIPNIYWPEVNTLKKIRKAKYNKRNRKNGR